ncbi:ATP-binding protein [Desulforhopalus sp. 52FAK]
MKQKIKYKLFFTLLLTSVVASLALHFYVKVTFERSFKQYVEEQEMEQLQELTTQLKSFYKQQGDWSFIAGNHHLWKRLHDEALEGQQSTEMRPKGRPGNLPPPPSHESMDRIEKGPAYLGPRIILYDADKNWIIGGPEEHEELSNLLPIKLEETVIGYLGLLPAKALRIARDRHFIQKQARTFAFIPLIIVVLSLLLSYPMAVHLLRPVVAMTEGTAKLIAGRFKTRIPVTTNDELGRLSQDFNILAMTLEKNEKNRKQWVADISHELRTPLSVLRGEIEALQDGMRQPDTETLSVLHSEVMHLERMVGDLYELSMSDIGALSYRKVVVDPVGILVGVVELYELRLAAKNIKVTTDFYPASCSMVADPDRMQQLFSNILENSLRYTDENGSVNLKFVIENDCAIISIEDSLPTVSETGLAKLFDRFYRVDGSRNRKTGGAGLGLAICKNIVEGHGGEIKAACSSIGGVGITITFPLAA